MTDSTSTAALPGMATALDVDAMASLVSDSLANAGESFAVEELRVLDVRYRPQQPCWVLYRLKGRDANGKTRRQLLSGRLRGPGAPEPELPVQIRDRYDRFAPDWLRTPALSVPSLPMTLYPYPVDAALPGLFEIASPDAMKSRLARLWSDRNVKVREVRVHEMGYTPHARAAFGYEVLCESRARKLPEVRRLVGKTHAKKPAYRLFRDSWAIWRAGGQRIGLAPPAGYIGAIGLTLQERVEGVRLGGVVDDPGLERMTRRTGRAIARFHSLEVPLSSRRKLAEEVRGVDRWAGILMEIRPDLKGRVQTLRAGIVRELETRMRLCAPVHADFHHTNVLVDGDRVTIIDLDETAFGDPMLDVGRFMASLRVPSRRVYGRIDALQEAGEAFLDEYMRHRNGDERRARVFEAASLLTSAGSSFRVQRAGWEEEVELLIAESERVLDLAKRGSPPQPALLDGRPELSASQQRRWARDGEFMQAALDPHIRNEFGALVERCEILKGKASECRYLLKGDLGGERWRARVDSFHKPRGSRSLADGLEQLASALDGAAHAPRLPRPLAALPKIGHVVWSVPKATSLSELESTTTLGESLRAVGKALQTVHGSGIKLSRITKVDARVGQVSRFIESTEVEHPPLHAELAPVFGEIAECLANVPEWLRPTLRVVHPNHVGLAGSNVALRRVEDLVLSHPLLDVADLSARLIRLGARREREGSGEGRLIATEAVASEAVGHLGNGYRGAWSDGEVQREVGVWLPAFQALALVGIVARHPESPEAECLLARASAQLAAHRTALRPESAASGIGQPTAEPTPDQELAEGVAKKCKRKTRVLGSSTLTKSLVDLGVDVCIAPLDSATSGDANGTSDSVDTVVLAQLGSAADPEAAIREAWEALKVRGRMIVVARHQEGTRPSDGERAFSRRELWRLLRPLARPHVESEQPFDWVVMTLTKRKRRSPRSQSLARDRRYRVTASLCRGRILELGCGEGHLSGLLMSRGHEVTGVELNRPKTRSAQHTYPDGRFLEGDIRTVELDEVFDTVVLAEVLEHVTETPGTEILERAWDFVAPGGRLIVSVPNENLIPHPNHVRQFDSVSLEAMLSRFGTPEQVTRQPFKWLMMFVDRGVDAL